MQEALRAERNGIKAKIASAVQVRRPLIEQCLADRPMDQDGILDQGRSILGEKQWSEKQRIIIEYELSYLGVNLLMGEKFMPMILRYLDDSRWQSRALFDVGSVSPMNSGFTFHLLDDMAEIEYARWAYSHDDRFAGETDLGEHTWCLPENYEDLREETTDFLRDKPRILEIGFLHQRIHDLIKSIDVSTEYHGVDISIPAVSCARRKGITAFNANAWHAIPYPDGYFDGVITSTIKASGLYWNPEMERVLKNPSAILNFDLQ